MADIVLEVEMNKIIGNKPYTIYTSKPLLNSETKLYLKFMDTLPLMLTIDYFKMENKITSFNDQKVSDTIWSYIVKNSKEL